MIEDVETVARAPGKIILFGEHSVVYGEPAIVAALDRGLAVRVRAGIPLAGVREDTLCRRAIEVAASGFGLDANELAVEIASEIPLGVGLGSSAALSVALVRALGEFAGVPLEEDSLRERATRVEDVFHGTSSGVDVAAARYGGVLWFERRERPRIEPLFLPGPLELVVALSPERRSTAGPVGRLRERVTARSDLFGRMFSACGDVAREAREALESGDAGAVGDLMNVAHGLLNGLGVSTPSLERMVGVARDAGALGAKLTGGGGGGAILALAPGRTLEVAEALSEEGFPAFPSSLGCRGRKEETNAAECR